jgi:transmembrane sensor
MTIDTQAMAWAMRAAEQGLDARARAELDAWCALDIRHEGAYLRALAILHTVDAAAAEQRKTGAPLPHQLDRRFGKAANARWWLSGALAAGLAAVLVANWRPAAPPPALVVATAKGEMRQVALADRSTASVNSASRIEVEIGENERRVRLAEGEAWFAVAKDPGRPFVVEAGQVRVRAVGTAFSVRRDAAGTQVLVTEGVVEVWRDGAAARQRLAAGESARLDPGLTRITIARQAGAVQRALAWREGKLIFQNDTLEAAAREFNRYNARPIVIADRTLAGRTVVGQYRIDGPERFAGDMRAILNVPVQVTPVRILIGAARASSAR